MPQSISKIWVHLVFSTKEQLKFLVNSDIRREAHACLSTILCSYDCPTLAVGGAEDHVHALLALSENYPLESIVEHLKQNSARWIKSYGPAFSNFDWQEGYGVFSVGPLQLDEVRDHILAQEEHHRNVSFEDEYRRLLNKHHLQFDEREVWD